MPCVNPKDPGAHDHHDQPVPQTIRLQSHLRKVPPAQGALGDVSPDDP